MEKQTRRWKNIIKFVIRNRQKKMKQNHIKESKSLFKSLRDVYLIIYLFLHLSIYLLFVFFLCQEYICLLIYMSIQEYTN